MRTRVRHWMAAVFTAAALTACQDLGTLPADLADAPPAQVVEGRGVVGGAALRDSEYVCYTSMATPGGEHAYRYGRIPLRFPAAAAHPANATHRYRYRMVNGDGKVLRAANCVIPRSDLAVEMMNRRFGVPEQDGELQVQGCVSGGVCTLEPIVVDGGGSEGCDPYLEADWSCDDGGGTCMTSVSDPEGELATVQGCETGGSGGPGGDTAGPGGGTSPNPGEPDSWDDGTGRPACERDANGMCITRELTDEEWRRFAQRVEEIRETSTECAGAKQALRDALAQGPAARRIRFWDGYDIVKGEQRYGQRLTDTQGSYVEYDSHWVWDRTEMPWLIVHEGLHLYFAHNPHPTLQGEELHAYIYSIDDTCI